MCRDMPEFLCHVTNLQDAVKMIASNRAIKPCHGAHGTGIYTVACRSVDGPDLVEVYDRLQGTAKGGAVFIMKPHGVLIRAPADSHRSKKDEAVGPGGIGFIERNDESSHQYVANHGSVEYMFLMVHVPTALKMLEVYMRQWGYTKELHDELLEAARHFEQERGSSGTTRGPTVVLSNSVIRPPWLVCHCCWGPPRLTECGFGLLNRRPPILL